MAFKLNQRGVSLLELTVSIGIGGMVTMLLVSAAKFVARSQANLQIAVTEETETLLGDFFVSRDLLAAGQSFNVLGACRTAGNQPVGFYDLDPNAPGCDGTSPPASCSPSITLTVAPGQTRSTQDVIFLTAVKAIPDASGSMATAMQTLAPNDLYTMTGAPSLTQPGTVSFGDGSKLRTKLNGFKMMKENSLLRFYSPYEGRRLLAGGNDYDYSIPPRNISLMTYVSGGNLATTPPPFIQCQASYDYQNIVYLNAPTPVGAYSRIDAFFRLLPAWAGMDAFAMVVMLEARRYTLHRDGRGRNPFTLMAATWSPESTCPPLEDDCEVATCSGGGTCHPGIWKKRRKVLTGIAKNFQFSRPNIRMATFAYDQDVEE